MGCAASTAAPVEGGPRAHPKSEAPSPPRPARESLPIAAAVAPSRSSIPPTASVVNLAAAAAVTSPTSPRHGNAVPGDGEKHPHPKALPELPCAVALAAVLNDVGYFKSTFALIAAKQQKAAAGAAATSPPLASAASAAAAGGPHGAARPPIHSYPAAHVSGHSGGGPRIRQLSCGDADATAAAAMCAPEAPPAAPPAAALAPSSGSGSGGGGGGADLAPIRAPTTPPSSSGGGSGDPQSSPPGAAAAGTAAHPPAAGAASHLEPHRPPLPHPNAAARPVHAALLAVTGGGGGATPAGDPASPVPLVSGAGTPMPAAGSSGGGGGCGPLATPSAGGLTVRSLATYVDRRVHDDEVIQVRHGATAGGAVEVVGDLVFPLQFTDRCKRGVRRRRRGVPPGR